jgi:hypothetical protein
MSSEVLIHIVPRFHPQSDGAGEYAFNLARALRAAYVVQSQFIACDPERDGPSQVEDFGVQRLRVRNEAGIWNLLSSAKQPYAAVVLHYCPYGYAKQGLPLWLYRGIKSWLEEQGGANPGSDKQLVTVFHNMLQTPLKPWNKEFCLRLPQRWLLQQFHCHSKFSMTTNHRLPFVPKGIATPKDNWLINPEGPPPCGKSPDWGLIARRFYEALHEDMPAATADVSPGKREGDTKPRLPAYASGLELAEPPVERVRSPA